MSLTRPTLISVAAFDATQSQTFTFNVTGTSSQVVANTLTIRNNDTNDIVYQEKQETYRYEHIVNANELVNGTYYNATISVFDSLGNQSAESVPIQFWCYSEPIIEFTNIPSTNIIGNSSFNFEFTYSQSEHEPLNSFSMTLYNSSQVQISSSGLQYTGSNVTPYNGSYTFTGFENNTTYYIQLVGTTIEGTIISTSLQQFTVQYIKPDLFTLVQLGNNCDEGYITITSNIVLIEGTSSPDPPVFISQEEIDLTGDGNYVQWDNGFNINGNMLSRIWFRNPNPYSTIAQFSNTSGQQFTLNYMLGYENSSSTELQSYVELYVHSVASDIFYVPGLNYYIYSNYVDTLNENEQYVVYLNRLNDIYSLQLLTNTTS